MQHGAISRLSHSFCVCYCGGEQTGAGKTFTMEGTPTNPGINYRTMKELFRQPSSSLPCSFARQQTNGPSDAFGACLCSLLCSEVTRTLLRPFDSKRIFL